MSSEARRPSMGDVALVALLAVLTVPWSILLIFDSGLNREPFAAQITFTIVTLLLPVAAVFRRSHPVASAVAVYLLALIHFISGATFLPADVFVLMALYSVVVHGNLTAGRAALGGAVLGSVLLAVGQALQTRGTLDHGIFISVCLASLGLSIATWAVAVARRATTARYRMLTERTHQLEFERDQQAQIATAAERTRIAREMHDIIAHSLSVIIAQADGGRYAATSDPEAAARALATVSEVGRASLADVRRLLGVLRDPGDDASPTQPQPLDVDLDELVEKVRSSGTPVSIVRMGSPRNLPPGASLAIYRIVQEALTNALKHAGPHAQVTVLVQWLPSALSLEISDDGRGAASASDGKGHGLVGMRERAAIFGGTVAAGPRAGGGFQVKALIPLPEQIPLPPEPVTPQPQSVRRMA